jgi:iron complex transport system substrate-binding protein
MFARLAAALAALLILVPLAACNSSADSSLEAGAGGESVGSAGGTNYPLTLPTPYGSTTLEAKPERVAIVGPVGDVDNVMALGVIPVAAPKYSTTWPWLDQDAVAKIEKTYETAQASGDTSIPFETVAAATPDVIIAITDTGLEKNYAKLSQIAPVVALPDKPTANEVDWEAALRLTGTALDRSETAEEQIAATEAKIAETKQAHPEFAGKSVSFAVNYGADYGITYFNYAGSPAETFLTDLGFTAGANAADFTATDNKVSAEQIPLLDSDVLVVNYNGGEEVKQEMESDNMFRQLRAVQSGHYVGLLPTEGSSSPLAWSMARPSALNLQWAIADVAPHLATAAEGTQ